MTGVLIAVIVIGAIIAMAVFYTALDRSQKARRDVARSDEEGFLRDEGTVGEVLSEETDKGHPNGRSTSD